MAVLCGEELEGDGAFEFGVFSLVDDTHRAFAEFFDDAVVADGADDQDAVIVPSWDRWEG